MRFSSLVQRGNLYYFQCRVPADIKKYFPGTQIRKSLKTNDRKQALTMVKVLTAKTERLFFMARSGILTPMLIERLVQEFMDNILDIDKHERYGIADTPLDAVVMQQTNEFRSKHLMDSRKDYEMYSELDKEMVTVSGAENQAFYYRCLVNRCHEQARKQEYSEISPYADQLLKAEGIKADPAALGMFCDALLAKEAEANEVMALRAERGLDNEYDRTHVSGSQKPPRRLSSLINKYAGLHAGMLKARSKQKPRESFDKIIELLGDPYTYEVSQNMLVKLFDDLAKYPKYRNHQHFKDLTIEQCQFHPKYEPLDIASLKGVWFALGAVLTYGSENGEYGIARNFCRDKIFSVRMRALTKSKKDKLDRLPYSRDNIQALIVQLAKRYCLKNEPHKLWIPLIAMYNGMRQGEICQLYCDDIVTVDGIDCFRIIDCEDRHQSVKNDQSERIIPIHPTLIKLGFMDFITSRRRLKYQRPWQGMKSRPVEYYAVSNNYNHYFEKWYNDTFRKYVIPDELECKCKPFHSLRHTFINWFFQNIRSQDRDNAAVKGLAGHLETEELKIISAVLKGISWDVYSQDLNPARLLETLSLLDYDIDLSPLGLPIEW